MLAITAHLARCSWAGPGRTCRVWGRRWKGRCGWQSLWGPRLSGILSLSPGWEWAEPVTSLSVSKWINTHTGQKHHFEDNALCPRPVMWQWRFVRFWQRTESSEASAGLGWLRRPGLGPGSGRNSRLCSHPAPGPPQGLPLPLDSCPFSLSLQVPVPPIPPLLSMLISCPGPALVPCCSCSPYPPSPGETGPIR